MSKHSVEVVLVVTSPDVRQPGNTRFLVLGSSDGQVCLPSQPLHEQESSIECASHLLREYTGLEAKVNGVGWVNLVQCRVADSPNRKKPSTNNNGSDEARWLAIPYGCMVPAEVMSDAKDRHVSWLTFGYLVGLSLGLYLDHMDILTNVARNI